MKKPNRKCSIRLTEDQWREIWACVQSGYTDHMEFVETCAASEAEGERESDFLLAAKDEMETQLARKLEK